VARIVQQLGGQLRVESKENEGSRFSFLIPLTRTGTPTNSSRSSSSLSSLHRSSRASLQSNPGKEIDSLVEALGSSHMDTRSNTSKSSSSPRNSIEGPPSPSGRPGTIDVPGSNIPLRAVKVNEYDTNTPAVPSRPGSDLSPSIPRSRKTSQTDADAEKLRVLIVEVGFSPYAENLADSIVRITT